MGPPAIRPLSPADRDPALQVIHTAARWYREFLPAAEVRDPEMTAAKWEAEARRVTWSGALVGGDLVGVMGLESVRDAARLRHAYILPVHQRCRIGAALREDLEARVQGVRRIIVGTYAGNSKARGLLEQAGYVLWEDAEAIRRR